MPITYTIAIDRDDDGDFADMGEDITADVLALHWRLGMQAAHDSMAPPGTAQITLRNIDQTYSPEINPLQPGQVVRIQSDDGSTVRTHFVGHITHIEPQPGDQGRRRAIIHAADASWQFAQHIIRLPPQVNARADEVIEQILDRMPLRRAKLKGYWVLGKLNHSELATNTRLPIATILRSLETGQSTFTYIGDTWGDGVPADAAIRQMAESERGRFFIDRSGQAVFYNRHHLLKATDSLATFVDDMAALEYDYGAGTISRVQVRLLPRSIGSDGTTLWELESPLRIPARTDPPLQVIARFRDAEGRPIGALALMTPVPNLDYTAAEEANGSGIDLTGRVDVVLRRSDFSAVLLEIRNRANRDAYLQPGTRIRGTPLYTGDPLVIEQTSHNSLAFYSSQTLRFDLPALDSAEEADSLARYELARRKTPRGNIRSLTLSSTTHRAQILARTLFDRITVQEAQTGHSTDYFILAESHTVDLGSTRHHITWTLESADSNRFWLLGYSLLNLDTVLGY
jgi:hypothetical protein